MKRRPDPAPAPPTADSASADSASARPGATQEAAEAAEDDFAVDPDAALVLPIDGTLDLHTFSPRELGELIPDYITECLARGIRELRIIHGKGQGVLRRSVHSLLRRDPRVAAFHLADADGGGWGATLVSLRPG